MGMLAVKQDLLLISSVPQLEQMQFRLPHSRVPIS